jgi:hypothetical protein
MTNAELDTKIAETMNYPRAAIHSMKNQSR